MFDFFKNTAKWYMDTMRFYNIVYELSDLSEEELKELELTRSEIPYIAMKTFTEN